MIYRFTCKIVENWVNIKMAELPKQCYIVKLLILGIGIVLCQCGNVMEILGRVIKNKNQGGC